MEKSPTYVIFKYFNIEFKLSHLVSNTMILYFRYIINHNSTVVIFKIGNGQFYWVLKRVTKVYDFDFRKNKTNCKIMKIFCVDSDPLDPTLLRHCLYTKS